MEELARTVREQNEIKGVRIEKKAKITTFAGDMILCTEIKIAKVVKLKNSN